MISKVISAAAIAAAAVSLGACSSSETSTLANGLIASASLTDKDNAEAGAKIGQTAGTTFTVATGEEDTLDVSWNTGPYSGKTRTFESKGTDTVGTYEVVKYGYVKEDVNDKDDGVLFVTSTEGAGFALGAMFTEGKSGAAAGATHFGNAPTNIPSSGTVTYSGLNAGFTVNGDDTGDQFDVYNGTSNITANFGDGTVTGTLTGLPKDVIFTGQMSQGNAVYAANNADIFYGDASVSPNSKLIGGFYNDHATSTAGVYDIRTLGDTPIRAIGGFAAAAPPG